MKYRRLNFEATDTHVTVCRDNHDKGQPCEYEEMTAYEVVDMLDDIRSKLLRAEAALEKIATVNAMDYEYVAWAKEALKVD